MGSKRRPVLPLPNYRNTGHSSSVKGRPTGSLNTSGRGGRYVTATGSSKTPIHNQYPLIPLAKPLTRKMTKKQRGRKNQMVPAGYENVPIRRRPHSNVILRGGGKKKKKKNSNMIPRSQVILRSGNTRRRSR